MKQFKGGKFKNRYRIEGILTAESPLHIGDGDMAENEIRLPETDKSDTIPKFNTVMVDDHMRAYIPGSTLKGNMRSWITQVFTSVSGNDLACVNDSGREREVRGIIDKCNENDKAQIREELSKTLKMVEFLFGSAVNEGKAEFWDSRMEEPPRLSKEKSPAYAGYDPLRGTIIMKSVAIDIKKGTAAKNKLYNYEAVPRGTRFKVTVCGQNLDKDELGMLLFALEGFNSSIYPLTVGAMGGVGFGRFRFELSKIYCLDESNYKQWIRSALENNYAGYERIPDIGETFKEKVQEFKQAFLRSLEEETS